MSALAKPDEQVPARRRRAGSRPGVKQNRVHTVVVAGQMRRVKRCSGCGETKIAEPAVDDSGFYVSWYSNGRPCFYTHCKACRSRDRRERMAADPEFAARTKKREREIAQRWRAAHPERSREVSLASYHRRKAADPETINANARLNYRLRKMRKGEPVEPVSLERWRDRAQPRIPASPFSAWLKAYRRSTNLSNAALARQLGMSERRLRSVLAGEYDRVALDVVDRALTNAVEGVYVEGRLILDLGDLYPDLAVRAGRYTTGRD